MSAELWLKKPCEEHGSVFRHQTDDGKWCYPKMSRRLNPVQVAEHVGDTFIDFRTMSPVLQWERIFRMLRDVPIGGIEGRVDG